MLWDTVSFLGVFCRPDVIGAPLCAALVRPEALTGQNQAQEKMVAGTSRFVVQFPAGSGYHFLLSDMPSGAGYSHWPMTAVPPTSEDCQHQSLNNHLKICTRAYFRVQCTAVTVPGFLNEPQEKRGIVTDVPLNTILALFATLEKTGQSQQQMRSMS